MEERQSENIRELSVSDMLWKVLEHWRTLLVCMVVFAALLGAFSYVKSKNAAVDTVPATKEEQEVRAEELRESLSYAQLTQLTDTENYRLRLEETERWMEENPLAKLDPYNVPTITLQYYVDSVPTLDSEGRVLRDYNTDLTKAFTSFVSNMDNRIQMAKLTEDLTEDLTADEISYLISTYSVTDNSFSVTLIGTDESVAEKFADYMKDALEAYSESLKEIIGDHTLKLVNENSIQGTSESIINQRNTIMDRMNTLRTKLASQVKELSDEQKEIYEYDFLIESETEDTIAITEAVITSPSVSKKYIVLGALAGIFLAALWISAKYLLDGRIKSVAELESFRSTEFICEFDTEDKKRRLFGGVDRWIQKRKYHGRAMLPEKERVNILASNLKWLAEKNDISSIYVTGTKLNTNSSCILAVKEALRDVVKVEVGENVLTDAEALNEMVTTGVVLIWEYAEKSYYREVVQLKDLCSTQKVKVLGYVLEK
ncbi:MAG: hypothetical protein PUF59_01795 [Lachnospiraceae bacterium]|nr:hypothetical protein [Lachnospiraceae bacterium]